MKCSVSRLLACAFTFFTCVCVCVCGVVWCLQRGRDDEKVIVGKVTTHLEERWQRKKEIYDSWVQNVFEPVNTAVAEAVNKRVGWRNRVCLGVAAALTRRSSPDRFGDPTRQVPRVSTLLGRDKHT